MHISYDTPTTHMPRRAPRTLLHPYIIPMSDTQTAPQHGPDMASGPVYSPACPTTANSASHAHANTHSTTSPPLTCHCVHHAHICTHKSHSRVTHSQPPCVQSCIPHCIHHRPHCMHMPIDTSYDIPTTQIPCHPPPTHTHTFAPLYHTHEWHADSPPNRQFCMEPCVQPCMPHHIQYTSHAHDSHDTLYLADTMPCTTHTFDTPTAYPD